MNQYEFSRMCKKCGKISRMYKNMKEFINTALHKCTRITTFHKCVRIHCTKVEELAHYKNVYESIVQMCIKNQHSTRCVQIHCTIEQESTHYKNVRYCARITTLQDCAPFQESLHYVLQSNHSNKLVIAQVNPQS